MQIIHYGGDTFLTGDDIAFAVVEYAKALALAESSATIGIPFQRDDTSIGHLELLVGPASQIWLAGPTSQIVLESSTASDHELRDDALVASITQQIMLAEFDETRPIDVEDQADAALVIPDGY
jgi:hypothetical protein